MRLNHNLASLNICREQDRILKKQSLGMNRISSGFKINSSKENPNGLALSEKMRVQIRGLQIAQRNAQDGISMLQSADGALNNISSMLLRIRDLTVQGGGATNENDRKTIQCEINQMIEGIDDTLKNSDFNGKSILNVKDTTQKTRKMSIGANVGETIDIPIYNLSSDKLGMKNDTLGIINTRINPQGGIENLKVDKCLSIVDSAINEITGIRSKYGALCNRFEGTYDEVTEMHDAITGKESKIRDTDLAEAMMELARDNILIEAGQAMLIQCNKFPQDALKVLENVK